LIEVALLEESSLTFESPKIFQSVWHLFIINNIHWMGGAGTQKNTGQVFVAGMTSMKKRLVTMPYLSVKKGCFRTILFFVEKEDKEATYG
jgi:hypothetical protein